MIRILGRGGEDPGRLEQPLPDSPRTLSNANANVQPTQPDFSTYSGSFSRPPTAGAYPEQPYSAQSSFVENRARVHCPPYPTESREHQPHHPYPPYPEPYPTHYQPGDSQDRAQEVLNPYPEGLMGQGMERAKIPWFRRIGVLTILSIVACVAVFIATMGVNNCPAQPHVSGMTCVLPWLGRFSFEPMKINPMLGPSANTLLYMGGLDSVYVMDYHQAWRLLTAMWLHAGVIHIVCNMLGVYFLGVPMEREFGNLKFAAIYLLSGVSGAIVSTLFLENTISVGASGALFGLAGATLTELCINWDLYANRISAFLSLLILILINVAIGLLPYIDNFAHLGGLVAGMLLGLALLVKPQRGYVDLKDRDNVAHAAAMAEAGGVVVSARNTMCQNVTRIVAAVTFLGLLGAGLAVVLTGTHVNCPWCHYVDCVPTSLWDCNSGGSGGTSGAGPICQQIQYNNGTGVLACANGHTQTFQNMTQYSDYDMRVLCTQTCS